MNDTTPLSDDPRLTAYALDELEPGERAAVEVALQADPVAREVVRQIRAMTSQLETALAGELAGRKAHAQNIPGSAIVSPHEHTSESPSQVGSSVPHPLGEYASRHDPVGWGRLLRFPQFYYVISGAAAAAFTLMVIWRQPEFEAKSRANALQWQLAQEQRTRARENARQSATAESLLLTASDSADAPAADLSGTLARPGFMAPAIPAPMLAASGPIQAPFVPPGGVDLSGRSAPLKAAGRDRASTAGNRSHSAVAGTENSFVSVRRQPASSFSFDVGTRSYTNLRQNLRLGSLPAADSVRIEEWVNYFPYHYDAPFAAAGAEADPIAAAIEVADAPWAPGHRLVRIGLQAKDVPPPARPPASLVFLLDVSESMRDAGKLPLLQASLRRLVAKMHPDDRLAIVTYGGRTGLALESTPVSERVKIEAAIDALVPVAAGEAAGIELAYRVATAQSRPGGVNRVVLCTDGNFNLGVPDPAALVRLVSEQARGGIGLSVLDLDRGGLRDGEGEALAANGAGAHAYIDSFRDAERLLSEQVDGAIAAVARDVWLEVEFNPATVASYRLIGYESPAEQPAEPAIFPGRPDFGAGATATALYEIVPVAGGDRSAATPDDDELKYQPKSVPSTMPPAVAGELLTVKVKYRDANGGNRRLEFPATDSGAAFGEATPDFKFAAAVAQFGMQLRHSPYRGSATFGDLIEWASAGLGSPADDPAGLKGEFVGFIRRAQAVWR